MAAGVIVGSIRAAAGDLMRPALRGVLARSLGVTLAIVAVVWAIGTRLMTGWAGEVAGAHPVDVPHWLEAVRWVAGLLSGGALMIGLSFLIAPITTGVAGLFLDEVAAAVEATHYAGDPPGRPLPFSESLAETARFTALSLGVNLVCLILLVVPGINLVAFLIGNGWLIGREYFSLAARRGLDRAAAERLARGHRAAAFTVGVAAAALLWVPILNLATPLFATAAAVHLVKRVGRAG